ncbi:MAG: CCA tRNA nucleotidyltransferase [Chloroflexi bacterium]|nr:CCA tRNA nucleotidyltransferase [Chloroflexota bacterium]
METETIRRWLEADPLWRRAIAAMLQKTSVYLVGGTVRDALLQRPSCDLDLAVAHGGMALARYLANILGGAYVPLDAERDVGRVVLSGDSARQHIDVAALRAESIEEDLRARDFTINAMAVPLTATEWGPLLDPLKGRVDLQAKVLRAASPQAFHQDPLRILRAIRLRGALGFRIEAQTMELMQAALAGLGRVSAERLRDELAQILALDDAAEALSYAADLGVWQTALPEVPSLTRANAPRLITCQMIEKCLRSVWGQEGRQDACAGMIGVLRPYRAELIEYWQQELSDERPRWLLTKLAAVLFDDAEAAHRSADLLRRLRFSNREVQHVEQSLRAALEWWPSLDAVHSPPLAAYRYYREAGEAGVDGALLRLASSAAQGAGRLPLARSELLFSAWFRHRQEWLCPPPLLSGHDITTMLALRPGPKVGELLEALREAQVQGLVRTPQEAKTYVRQLYDMG